MRRLRSGTRAIQLRQPDLFFSRFLELYGRPNRLTLPERSGKANLGQALHMLAGSAYQEKLTAPEGGSSGCMRSGQIGYAKSFDEFYLAAYRAAAGAQPNCEDLQRAIVQARRSRAGARRFCLGRAFLARICGESLRGDRTMNCTGCLNLTRRESMRRDFLRVGSLGLLGINLPQFLRAADAQKPANGKAQSCILLWLEGGPSQMDTWDPKPNSAFKPISTNVAGIQVSELLPQLAKRMDKLALVRSMHTKGNDHPQGTHYAITGHEPNPAMHFPSLGAIISKEAGPRNGMPAHVLVPQWERSRQYEEYFRAGFLGAGLRSDGDSRSQPQGLSSRRSDAAESCFGAGRCIAARTS